MNNKPNRYTICMAKDNVIYDKLKETLDFLVLADAIPEQFSEYGCLFQGRGAAMRTLALYWAIRASNEQKYNLNSDIIKRTYNEIINGERYCMEVDGSCYFVRPVAFDDPVYREIGYYSTFDKYEKFIPTLAAYLINTKRLSPPCAMQTNCAIIPASSTNGSQKPPED